jgi:hypothetical protein
MGGIMLGAAGLRMMLRRVWFKGGKSRGDWVCKGDWEVMEEAGIPFLAMVTEINGCG